jgi:pyridoxamine 5'-phosphate oxidase
MNPADHRREYTQAGLDMADLAVAPLEQFRHWFKQAEQAGLIEPNAMSLATVGTDGRPSIRTVLLKAFDENGLVFFTNYESRKARELASNPAAALLFPWLGLERQVSVEGMVERISTAESLRYFMSRPYGSQLGAWVSSQSSVITTRGLLEEMLGQMKQKFAEGKVPLPPFWGGFRVVPQTWEFWQGRPNRLHDRFRYRKSAENAWTIERLAP